MPSRWQSPGESEDMQDLSETAKAKRLGLDVELYDDQQLSDEQVEDEQLDDQQLYDQQLDDQQLDGQQLDGQQLDDQQLDHQQLDDQHLDHQQLDGQQLDDQQLDDQQLDGQQLYDPWSCLGDVAMGAGDGLAPEVLAIVTKPKPRALPRFPRLPRLKDPGLEVPQGPAEAEAEVEDSAITAAPWRRMREEVLRSKANKNCKAVGNGWELYGTTTPQPTESLLPEGMPPRDPKLWVAPPEGLPPSAPDVIENLPKKSQPVPIDLRGGEVAQGISLRMRLPPPVPIDLPDCKATLVPQPKVNSNVPRRRKRKLLFTHKKRKTAATTDDTGNASDSEIEEIMPPGIP
jgi:hypothetical protein